MTANQKINLGVNKNRKGNLLLFAVLVFSLVGLGVSIHLTRIHYFTHTDASYHSTCAINEAMNCETVAQSPYSVFAGLPISAWGIIAYFFEALLAAWGLSRFALNGQFSRGLLPVVFFCSFCATGVLAYVSYFRINSMCIWCMTLYGTNAVSLALSVAILVRSRLNPLAAFVGDLAALARKPLVFGGMLICVAAAVAGAQIFVPVYWQHPGWQDLAELPSGVDGEGHHWIGAENPVVTIVEFSDYQCPHCRRAHKNMRAIIGKHPQDLRLIHRHQPLGQACNPDVNVSFHNRACEFSKAVVCAAKQDMFWEMNDAIFSLQDEIKADDVDVETVAVQLGIDRTDFKNCMSGEDAIRKIAADLQEAKKRNVKGTPTFFIGNQPYEGGIPESILVNTIEDRRK